MLDLAKFHEHVGHDHLWEERRKTSFPRRRLACWCASCEGWRFLEAGTCATFPFLGLRNDSARLQWRHHSCQTVTLATLLETVSTRLPTCRLWNVVDDISGHVVGSPTMDQVLVEGLPLSKGNSKVLIDGTDKLKQGLLQQQDLLGIDECDTARNVGADLQLGKRRRACVVKGRLVRAARRTKRVRQLRKAGGHTLAISRSAARTLGSLGSEVLGFTPTQLRAIRVDAAKATCRLSRGQNAATTMIAHAQAAGSKSIDRRSVTTDKLCWSGRPEFGRACPTSTPCRRRCEGRWPGVVRRQRRSSYLRAHAAAAGLERTVRKALTAHNGTKIDLLAVVPKTVGFWVDQASLMWSDSSAHWNQSKRPLFWKSSGCFLFLASWRGGHSGIATCWSSWFRKAFGRRSGSRGSGDGKKAVASSATTVQAQCSTAATSARPCKRSETCKSRKRCARRHVLVSHNTGSSLHTAFSQAPLPFCHQVHSNGPAQFWGTTGPQTGSWIGTFLRTAPRRAAALCGEQAGQWWQSTL